jgi:DNA (cytosine-5)-methyltransferase 1
MNELAHTQGLRELALFAGAGGGILGGHLLGWRTVCAVEWADYPRRVLLARQRDGILPRFPIWDDVQTFDGKPWRGRVDVISGGFPCQDISSAGKGAGITGERSGMWAHMARIIGEVEPEWVLVENSPLLTSRGLDTVLRDLAKMGYDAEWGVLGAIDAGGPHKRDRIWIVARRRAALDDSESLRRRFCNAIDNRPNAQNEYASWDADEVLGFREWWKTEPQLDRMAHGVANRVDRVKAIGNGQIPIVAALAFRILTERAGWAV